VRLAHTGIEVHTALRYGHPVRTLLYESANARMLVLGARGRHGLAGLALGSVAATVSQHAHCPVAVIRGNAEPDPSWPVVVGVDGSPISEDAVAVAFDQASSRHTALIAVHAWSEIPEHGQFAIVDRPAELRRIEAAERQLLAEQLASWREKYPDIPVEQVVVSQPPTAALLERAAGAQLLVVGSHGRGGFTGMLIGSTSRHLLHHAPCPLLVVRPTQH